jgi:hypothetical protein
MMNMKHYPRLRKFGLFNLHKDFPMKKLTFALSFAPIAFSGTAMAAPQWSSTVSIVQIEVNDVSANGTGPARSFLRFDAAPLSTPCSLRSNNDWQIGGSADNIKNIMTMATSAKLAGQPVKVLWNQGASNQCSAGGTTGYPVVIGLIAYTECRCANPIP